MGRLPDFVIVGFPKCGTHALLRNLGAHPEIFTHPDEVGFFGRERMTQGSYEALFASDRRLVGEKSAGYVLRRGALEHMARVIPEARIIVCLRHPVHMLHSFYNFRAWEHENGFEPGFDGRTHPFHEIILSGAVVKGFGLEVADYRAAIVGNVLASYPRDKVFFAIQERFWADPQASYDAVHDFLGVASRPVGFEIVNSRVSGGDRFPFVDYDHPDYGRALAKAVAFTTSRRGALCELIADDVPEWSRYDELYAVGSQG